MKKIEGVLNAKGIRFALVAGRFNKLISEKLIEGARPEETRTGLPVEFVFRRIHESGGEVHFHDDQNRIKAAVPVAAMYETWDKLKDGRLKKFKHKDLTNRSVLRIKVVTPKKGPKDLQMSVEPMADAVTEDFASLDKFIQGSHVG